MFASSIVTFRETLEAALVVGIILSFLSKTNQHLYKKFVLFGIVGGVVLSGVLALLLEAFFGGLKGRTEELFEGMLMFITAAFLTWMILWVHRQKDVARKLRKRVAKHVKEGYALGIFLLTTVSVFREGTETVLYLKALSLRGGGSLLLGGLLGLTFALALSFLLFSSLLRFKLTTIFNVTSALLLLFAAGLVSHGVHEFQELLILPIFSFDPIVNISHILDHKSLLGSLLRTLFGYTSKPTFLEAASYVSYLGFIFWLERVTDRLLVRKV